MATEDSVESVEEIETIASDRRGTRGGCKVQVGRASECANVEKIRCCDKVVTEVCPIEMCVKEMENSILKGKVIQKCPGEYGRTIPVENALVVATSCHSGAKNYVGLTDRNGEYRICVPASSHKDRKYIIEAYYCGSCRNEIPQASAE